MRRIAILLLGLIAIAVTTAGNKPERREYNHGAPASYAEGHKPTVAHSEMKAEDAIAIYTWWLMIFTGALAISTLGLWIATLFLWHAGEKQIEIAGKAAKAAQDSADILPKIERAYVFMRIKTGSVRGVEYVICNYGKTPAVLKAVDTNLKIFPEAPENLENNPVWQGYVLQVGEEWNPEENLGYLDNNSPTENILEFSSGRAFLWFYGSIVYDDVIGIERITRFRYKFNRSHSRFNADGGAPYNERT